LQADAAARANFKKNDSFAKVRRCRAREGGLVLKKSTAPAAQIECPLAQIEFFRL
jgi:hypothetical protein